MRVTMLDDSLAAQVPALVLLLVGCAALSAFIGAKSRCEEGG